MADLIEVSSREREVCATARLPNWKLIFCNNLLVLFLPIWENSTSQTLYLYVRKIKHQIAKRWKTREHYLCEDGKETSVPCGHRFHLWPNTNHIFCQKSSYLLLDSPFIRFSCTWTKRKHSVGCRSVYFYYESEPWCRSIKMRYYGENG